ncbi:hypothetical protein [Acinetobacter sp. YH01008]|uniref:hypothetical protein n=1 Tax=Acinetobacter sp. YH01008 TaxID=2601024 RepID=UPI0015D3DCEF|nr:hypothetical protein [Acinetobacter sp. YH01008]
MKKKDVFGKKLKLTKQEKRDHKSRMEKFETVSLYWTQFLRLLSGFDRFLAVLGNIVFPTQQTRQKLFEFASRLITKFWWFMLTPIVYQLISYQFSFHALPNGFFY